MLLRCLNAAQHASHAHLRRRRDAPPLCQQFWWRRILGRPDTQQHLVGTLHWRGRGDSRCRLRPLLVLRQPRLPPPYRRRLRPSRQRLPPRKRRLPSAAAADPLHPGVTTPAMCGEEPHSDPGGEAVAWGLTHKTASAAECCERCAKHAADPKNVQKPCNSWVFCYLPQCWSLDTGHKHTFGECWLKWQASSKTLYGQRGDIPKSSGASTRMRTSSAKMSTARQETSACRRTCHGRLA